MRKNQQIHHLFIQFINYVWYFLHVSTLHFHPHGAFLAPSERCSIEEQWYRIVDGRVVSSEVGRGDVGGYAAQWAA
jgi:hypothetical protein